MSPNKHSFVSWSPRSRRRGHCVTYLCTTRTPFPTSSWLRSTCLSCFFLRYLTGRFRRYSYRGSITLNSRVSLLLSFDHFHPFYLKVFWLNLFDTSWHRSHVLMSESFVSVTYLTLDDYPYQKSYRTRSPLTLLFSEFTSQTCDLT